MPALPVPKPHPRSSCGMLVLMEHSAKSVAPSYVKAGESVRRYERHGQWPERPGVRDALVGPVLVIEVLELAQGV